jgi:hypothetical protein
VLVLAHKIGDRPVRTFMDFSLSQREHSKISSETLAFHRLVSIKLTPQGANHPRKTQRNVYVWEFPQGEAIKLRVGKKAADGDATERADHKLRVLFVRPVPRGSDPGAAPDPDAL